MLVMARREEVNRMITNEKITELVGNIKIELQETARRLIEKNILSDRAWTQACFSTLSDIGTSQGFVVAPNKHNCEWLYDLVWKECDNDDFKSLVMVLESEWSCIYDKVMYDFLKIVQSTARIKVLICNSFDDNGMSQFLNAINVYEAKRNDEIYLFAMYTHDGAWKGFNFRIVQQIKGSNLFGLVE